MAAVVPVGTGTPYPHLRYTGGAAAKSAEQQDSPAFLAALDAVGAALNRVIDIFSGSGGPDVRGGGFAGDPHDLHIAADANVGGVPIGLVPGAVAAIHAQGLRTGATDFTYQGKPDYAHVDAVGGSVATATTPPATAGGIASDNEFWLAVEHRLGITGNPATHAFLEAWANAEGTAAHYNPLATTLKLPGSQPLGGNPDGVQQYATPEQGVTATADTIRKYPAIMAALKNPSYMSFSSPGVKHELTVWSGNTKNPTGAAQYISNVLRGFQGNPSGSSASDWLSFDGNDLGNAAKKAASAITPEWIKNAGLLSAKLLDPHTWWRVGLLLAGGILVLAGILTMAHGAGVSIPPVVPLP